MKASPRLIDIIRYPLKSSAGWSVQSAEVSQRGLVDDRRWMVVDRNYHFLSAREHGSLLTIRAQAGNKGALSLSADGYVDCMISAPNMSADRFEVQVWSDRCLARDMGDQAAQWISAVVGQSCRLVYMPDETERAVSGETARAGDVVSFADGYPLLLTLKESLDAINEDLEVPVEMGCFRPNVVVAGFEPFRERTWSSVRIGTAEFAVAGPCVRCQMTTRDLITGRRRTDGQPLKALAKIQRTDQGVVFGINLIPRSSGFVRCGDPVEPSV